MKAEWLTSAASFGHSPGLSISPESCPESAGETAFASIRATDSMAAHRELHSCRHDRLLSTRGGVDGLIF
jgi:hypothetical protein